MALIPPVTRRIMAGDLNEMFNSLILQINAAGGGGGGMGSPVIGPAQQLSSWTAPIPAGWWYLAVANGSVVINGQSYVLVCSDGTVEPAGNLADLTVYPVTFG
jgi:hypothetical protein